MLRFAMAAVAAALLSTTADAQVIYSNYSTPVTPGITVSPSGVTFGSGYSSSYYTPGFSNSYYTPGYSGYTSGFGNSYYYPGYSSYSYPAYSSGYYTYPAYSNTYYGGGRRGWRR